MIPLLNGILTGGDVFMVKLSKKNWFIRKWRRRHSKRWSEVQKTTFSGFKVLVFRMLEGFIQTNRRIFTLQISAFRLSSTSHPTRRLFWSNFSNWSSLFSPGSISVSDRNPPSCISLKNGRDQTTEFDGNLYDVETKFTKYIMLSLQPWLMTLLMAWPVAQTNKTSSLVQIHPNFIAIFKLFFFSKKTQFNAISLVMHFFSRISGASKSHGFRCSSTKTSKP